MMTVDFKSLNIIVGFIEKMKYSLIPPLSTELNIYIINGIATTQSHKSLAKLPLVIVNPN